MSVHGVVRGNRGAPRPGVQRERRHRHTIKSESARFVRYARLALRKRLRPSRLLAPLAAPGHDHAAARPSVSAVRVRLPPVGETGSTPSAGRPNPDGGVHAERRAALQGGPSPTMYRMAHRSPRARCTPASTGRHSPPSLAVRPASEKLPADGSRRLRGQGGAGGTEHCGGKQEWAGQRALRLAHGLALGYGLETVARSEGARAPRSSISGSGASAPANRPAPLACSVLVLHHRELRTAFRPAVRWASHVHQGACEFSRIAPIPMEPRAAPAARTLVWS